MLQKIAVGTGQLGRGQGSKRDLERIQAIQHVLGLDGGLHISPTYGESYRILRRARLRLETSNSVFVKIDFSTKSQPHVQLSLTEALLEGHEFTVQISGDIRNMASTDGGILSPLAEQLNSFYQRYPIKSYLFSPLYHDTHTLLKFTANLPNATGLALHLSLTEKEYNLPGSRDDVLLDRFVLALRGIGGGLGCFSDWFGAYNAETKPTNAYKREREVLQQIVRKYGVTELEARFQFIMKHPYVNTSVISFSTIDQVQDAVRILQSDSDLHLLSALAKYHNIYPNLGRRGLGFRYPANTTYGQFHATRLIFNASNNLALSAKIELLTKRLLFRILVYVARKIRRY